MPSTTPDLFDSSPLPVQALPGLSLAPAVPQGTPRRAARELWLCLLLPGLPLEALVGDGVGGGRPACVVDGEGTRQVVVAVNDAAARHGVRPGLGLNAALALCAGLDLLKRRPDAEAALLERLARWGTQFTPWVSLEPPQALLAEVRGSLGLFGGAANLRRRAVQELFGRGLRAVAALAPTPRSALWLARAGLEVTVESGDELPSFAARLPLACLGWPQAAMQTLATLGTRSVADLARLPRDGLARRLGPALLDELDEGFGRRAQPRRRAVLPERFDDALELPAESASGGLIELALDRLLGRLQDFLRDRSGGVRGLLVEFRHRGLPPTRLRLGLARPGDDARHLAMLLRERLAHTPLPAPVVSLRMRSTAVVPLELRAGSLPGETRRDADPEAAARLLERLRARLGTERVFSVCLVPEHRPELAWRVAEPLLPGTGNAPGKGESADGARGRKRAATGACGEEGQGRAPPERATSIGASGVAGPAAASSSPQAPATSPSLPRAPNAMRRLPRESRLACAPVALRPLWILAEPQRLQERDGSPWHEGGPLELVSGPERIESGWWDGGDVRRDYYVATERGGVRLWVYGERDPGGGWWLHGVFG